MKQHVPLVRPFIDTLCARDTLSEALGRPKITCGTNVEALEDTARDHLASSKAEDVVAVSSCTNGLMLVFKHLRAKGYCEGRDTILMPSFTFGATLLAALWAGWKVRLVDVLPNGTIDPQSVHDRHDEKVAAVVAVDVFGHPAHYHALRPYLNDKNITLVADSAQAFGSYYNGFMVGSQADYHVFSMSPSKVITAGEGGLISGQSVCKRRRSHQADFRALRDYGKKPGSLDFNRMGLSARMSEFNAAVGHANMARLVELVHERRMLANAYDKLVATAEMPGIEPLHPCDSASDHKSNYAYYVLEIDPLFYCVKSICRRLKEHGVETKRYFDPTLEMMNLARANHNVEILPCDNAMALAESCVAIPMFNGLTLDQQEYVVQTLKKVTT